MNQIENIIADLRAAHEASTPGKWSKGRTTHHTVAHRPGVTPSYPIAEFHHALDATFCDLAHEFIPAVCDALDASRSEVASLKAQLPSETGLTPRQLLEQRDALAEALQLLLREVDDSAIAGAKDYGWPIAVSKSRAALALVKGEAQ